VGDGDGVVVRVVIGGDGDVVGIGDGVGNAVVVVGGCVVVITVDVDTGGVVVDVGIVIAVKYHGFYHQHHRFHEHLMRPKYCPNIADVEKKSTPVFNSYHHDCIISSHGHHLLFTKALP